MNYQISSTHIDISESMKSLVHQKMARLEKRFSDDANVSARVVLDKGDEEGTFLTKIELTVEGEVFYTEEPGFTLENSIIESVEELDRQYRKQKGKDEKKTSKMWEKQRESKALSEEDLLDNSE